MSARFTLGQRVKVTGTARKAKRNEGWQGFIAYEDGPPPTRYNYPDNKVYGEGVIVGSRTLRDGRFSWEDGDATYIPTGEPRLAWLVAFDMRMKPVLCFDYQVEEMS